MTPRPLASSLLASSLLASSLLAASLHAQTTVVDEGSFTLTVNGNRIGREQFSIKRNVAAGVTTMLARATVTLTLEERRLEATLRTDSAGQPIEFSLDEYVAGNVVSRVRAANPGGRFAVRVNGPAGQSEKEMRLPPRAVLADAELIHPLYFYFLPPRGAERVQVVQPRTLGRDSVSVRVVAASAEVDVGNGNLPSRHLMVTTAAGTATDVWLDARGRVLRVAVPSRGFVASRDEPPGGEPAPPETRR